VEKVSSIKKNLSYNIAYQILTIILPLITSPYLARVLGPANIGVYSWTHAIAHYFVLFTMLGLNKYGNRTIAGARDDKDTLSRTFCEIYCLQLITGFISILVYVAIVLLWQTGNENESIFFIQTIYVISAIVDVNWLYFGLEKFKETVTRNVIIKIISVCMVFIFVKQSTDLWKYVLIMTGSLLAGNLVLWVKIPKYVNITKITKSGVLKHLRPNLVLFVSVISVSIYKIMDKLMLGGMSTMIQTGFYENSEKITQVPLGIIAALGTVMIPRMSHLEAKGDTKNQKKYTKYSMMFVFGIGSAMAFGMAAISDTFSVFFWGNDYFDCGRLIAGLSISILFVAWANVLQTQILIPQKKDNIYLVSILIGAGINITINALLIPQFGAFGAVIGTICSECAVAITQTIPIKDELHPLDHIKTGIPFVLAGLIMYFAVRAVGESVSGSNVVTLIIQIAVGGVVYILLGGSYLLYLRKKNAR
jgi:O-antigen/teichoic acid export membrane protein